ncbi:MAG: KUP/HAK/KT family potassium transporter, partial [Gammaproteobacteria bacterium]|nr:KUP/HAK/KT family potassium transporter [Gammaproteobacteria bacterium]
EALYADMGHLGRGPIRLAWFTVVLPGLLLNYFGQGAFILRTPDSIENIFFLLAPTWGLIPLVILATIATIIASQAVISGAFSLTSQAIQLGYCPRFNIIQTSPQIIGQIYIPFVNWMFLIAAIVLVFTFRESGRLVAAYGLAVSTTMFITALFLYFIAKQVWHWHTGVALMLALPFVLIHFAYLCATLLKIPGGGWFPLLIAAVIYLLMSTWEQGLRHLRALLTELTCSCELFLEDIKTSRPHRVPGIAVFLTRNRTGVPRTLLHNFKHNRILHETNIFLTIETERVPKVRPENRASVESYGSGLHRIILHFGFHEHPNVPATVQRAAAKYLDLTLDPMNTTYFLGRETLIVHRKGGMPMQRWRRSLFAFMLNNASHAAHYFRIPVNRVVEFGSRLEI